jgi:hypothetical protein
MPRSPGMGYSPEPITTRPEISNNKEEARSGSTYPKQHSTRPKIARNRHDSPAQHRKHSVELMAEKGDSDDDDKASRHRGLRV